MAVARNDEMMLVVYHKWNMLERTTCTQVSDFKDRVELSQRNAFLHFSKQAISNWHVSFNTDPMMINFARHSLSTF